MDPPPSCFVGAHPGAKGNKRFRQTAQVSPDPLPQEVAARARAHPPPAMAYKDFVARSPPAPANKRPRRSKEKSTGKLSFALRESPASLDLQAKISRIRWLKSFHSSFILRG